MTIADVTDREMRSREARKRVLLQGCIVYEKGAKTVNCSIKDITDQGARVALPTDQMCPDSFFLIAINQGLAHQAHVIWRRAREIGLRFEQSFPVAGITDSSLIYLRRIWVDRAPR